MATISSETQTITVKKAPTLTWDQCRLLADFFTHCICVYHHNAQEGFAFWADRLDEAGIPWTLQNKASCLADDRTNQRFYFKTLMKQEGVTII